MSLKCFIYTNDISLSNKIFIKIFSEFFILPIFC
nr:MAG TPA: hypothetical protein [Bacteriophage sp.]